MDLSNINNDFQYKAAIKFLNSTRIDVHTLGEAFNNIFNRNELTTENLIRQYYLTNAMLHVKVKAQCKIRNLTKLINETKFDIFARVFDMRINEDEPDLLFAFIEKNPDCVDLMLDAFSNEEEENALDRVLKVFEEVSQSEEQLKRAKRIYKKFLKKEEL